MVSSIAAMVLLAACGSSTPRQDRDSSSGPLIVVDGQSDGFYGTVVADPPLELPRGPFYDTTGDEVVLGSQTTGVTVLFFGFTNCDDICPTTMADLAAAKRSMSAGAASQVRVDFVTVDPARDTPAELRRWLAGFDTAFIGLRAPRSVVHAAEQSLYAPVSDFTKQKPSQHSSTDPAPQGTKDYEVNHTGSVYVFGPDGTSVLYTGGTTPAEYASDFRKLLSDR